MQDNAEILDLIRNLLESQRLGVLSTQDHGQPYCNIIAIAATADLKYLLFATTRATRKYANLMADSRVAVLVDNRRNDAGGFCRGRGPDRPGAGLGSAGGGTAAVLEGIPGKHPYLEEFAAAPARALLRVRVDKYIVVTRFQEVREIQMPA